MVGHRQSAFRGYASLDSTAIFQLSPIAVARRKAGIFVPCYSDDASPQLISSCRSYSGIDGELHMAPITAADIVVFLVAQPGMVASIAAWTNGVRRSTYWSLAGVIALGWGMVAVPLSVHRLTGADIVQWTLGCVLPVTAAFFVARFRDVRDRRSAATCAAFLSYLLALVAGIYIATVVGVLEE